MKKGTVLTWLIVIIIGLWFGFSAIQALDEMAAKAEEKSKIPAIETRQ